jgi:predicted benzoate:H+ symporter BenE
MLSPQTDSNVADRRTKSAALLVVNGVIVGALVAFALISRGSSALISETAQAEFVSPSLHSASAIQIAQPAVHGWGARTN